MAARPEESLPKQMKNSNILQAVYRFVNNRHVKMDTLLQPHKSQTVALAREQSVVLWIEDTTELDYTFHPSKTGLGPIGDGKGRGVLLHSTIGVLPSQRRVLGLGHVQVVLREATAGTKKRRWTRTPESRLWEFSAHVIGDAPQGKCWVHVSDAGSDIFEYMCACCDHHKDFLLRVFHNRLLSWAEDAPEADQETARKMVDYARSLLAYPDSSYSVQLEARHGQPARQAQVVMAWSHVTVAPPEQAPVEIRAHLPLELQVLRIWEPNPPAGIEALEWILLTSLPVQNLAEAQRLVNWYSCRWLCEDFHQCLKTGCKIEKSQLDDGRDIQVLLGFAAPIAVRLLQLRQDARTMPEILANDIVDPLIVEVLARYRKIDPNTLNAKDFFRHVAGLGGFLGRKRDGDPGWRTLWSGWRYLSDLVEGARLFIQFDSS